MHIAGPELWSTSKMNRLLRRLGSHFGAGGLQNEAELLG